MWTTNGRVIRIIHLRAGMLYIILRCHPILLRNTFGCSNCLAIWLGLSVCRLRPTRFSGHLLYFRALLGLIGWLLQES